MQVVAQICSQTPESRLQCFTPRVLSPHQVLQHRFRTGDVSPPAPEPAQVLVGDQSLTLQSPQHDARVAALASGKSPNLLFREVGLGGGDKLPHRLWVDQPVSGQAVGLGLDRAVVLFVASTMEPMIGFQVEPQVCRRTQQQKRNTQSRPTTEGGPIARLASASH